MANTTLFQSIVGRLLPRTDTRNEELATAYALTPKQQLAQYTSTGCLNTTFYVSDQEQMEKVLGMCRLVSPEFIAQTAIYCREHGYMKDIPALLCAVLSIRDLGLLRKVFHRVIDNGKMLRTFVQIMRSGQVGRKSLGSGPKQLVQSWLDRQEEEAIFKAAVGQAPSLPDIIKMVHPKPKTARQEAVYGYLLGHQYDEESLPSLIRDYEAFKNGMTDAIPDVPFLKLAGLNLQPKLWRTIAKQATWHTTRMNLNTFARHGVFTEPQLVTEVASRLRDREAIKTARVFPYQLLMAYTMAKNVVPNEILEALQDAMEMAIENVPELSGTVYVCPDVSGSMSAPVTGYRKGSTSAVRCIDVAALVAAAMIRKNPTAAVLPFEQAVVDVLLNPRDSVMTNAKVLASIGGGRTNCSAPLARLNRQRAKGDLIIFISDNESWVDAQHSRGTATMKEWEQFKTRNPQAKLVCIDIQPYGTTQAKGRADILNIGGFSDGVFKVINNFYDGTLHPNHWVGEIEAVPV